MFLFCRKHVSYSNYIEFYANKDAEKWGTLHFGDWLPEYQLKGVKRNNYNDPIVRCLLMYLGFHHWSINSELRKNCIYRKDMDNNEEKRAICLEFARNILSVIEQKTIPENIVLYRIIGKIDYLLLMLSDGQKKIKIGSILTDKGFMSTGLVYDSLKKVVNGKILLRLLCPKGFKGVYTQLISSRLNEQEVLLPPNSTFSIVRIYRNRDNKIVLDCKLLM